jgi:anti-sigma-K factor RskA
MTDDRNMPDELHDLAAEYALGVLAGEELRRAQQLLRTDREFRDQVARWAGRLAPMMDDVEAVRPPEQAWNAIRRRIHPADDGANVVQLRRRLNRWRGIAAAMTALAACLAIFIAVGPLAPVGAPVERQRTAPSAAPLLAMLGNDEQGTKVVATWDPGGRQLVLAVTGEMPSDARHSHELWVIPAGGKPRSLGTMDTGKRMHMRLADALARLLQRGATIAISVEPPGGSPSGAPTGPVVASGALTPA